MYNYPLTSWDYKLQFKPQALYLMMGKERLWGHEIEGEMGEKGKEEHEPTV